jgi:predicted RNA-binding protein YlxR (DUF448 family)
MSRPRHVPQRTCVACRQVRPKSELLRIVRTPENRVQIDPGGKGAGRGAYVCRNTTCPQQAVSQKKLARALGAPVGEELLEEIARNSEAARN